MQTQLSSSAHLLRNTIAEASRGLVEREVLIELVALASVAQEHLLVIGPPGTAKSEAVRRIARATGGKYFEYLLGRFTEPSEIFGPVDLRKLKEGLVETEISGMLPEAEIAFLDEIFQGSTAILNTLLGILNERTFRRGHTNLTCPLRICVGASNALPTDESLNAFADRFLVRIFLDPLPDSMIENLLEGGWSLSSQRTFASTATLNDIDILSISARNADMSWIRPQLAYAVRLLRNAGIVLSDRRVVKAQRLIAAASVMTGRTKPNAGDLWPLIYVVPTREQQVIARDCLRELLQKTESITLVAAAEEASLGPIARANRVAAQGSELLTMKPPKEDSDALKAWRLKLEMIAREIDAGFSKENLPENLNSLRASIVEHLTPL